MLFIEHDMNVVFKFRQPHHRHGRWPGPGRRHAERNRRRRARARSLSRTDTRQGAPWLNRCSRSRTSAPATATPWCSTASRSRCRSRAVLRCWGGTGSASRRCSSPSWAIPMSAAAAITWRGQDITQLPPHRRALDGLGWVAQEREIFPSLSVEENLTVASRPGRWDLKAVYDLFPAAQRTAAEPRQSSLRRRAADARDRPRADDQSGAAPARRAARRAWRRSSSRNSRPRSGA